MGTEVGGVYPYDVTVMRREDEGFGFVIISSVTKGVSFIGNFTQPAAIFTPWPLIPNPFSPFIIPFPAPFDSMAPAWHPHGSRINSWQPIHIPSGIVSVPDVEKPNQDKSAGRGWLRREAVRHQGRDIYWQPRQLIV